MLEKLNRLFANRTVFIFRSYSKNIINVLLTMQRPIDKHVKVAQKQRKIIKERSTKYPASVVSLQVLGSGAKGCPQSLFIFSDQARYLFNCGEGTQRLAHEHKMKLAKLEHIFFTSAKWMNMGGLPGVALTLQDTGVPKITLHGPPDLDELFKATRRFVILKDMRIDMADCRYDTFYDDPVMSVKYIPLLRESNSSQNRMESEDNQPTIEVDDTDYYAHEGSGRKHVQDIDIKNLLDKPNKESSCMAYICRLKPTLGMLDLQKCVEKGVKPGPNLGLLKNGQDVTLADGTIVYAKDVKTPDDPGPVFIVIEVPHMDFLNSLLSSKQFSMHQQHENLKPEDCPSVIVHFTPNQIINHQKYQQFMKSFPEETKHLIINENNTCPGSIAISRMQSKLNLLDDKIFPVLKTQITHTKNIVEYLQEDLLSTINKLNNEDLSQHIKNQLQLADNLPTDTNEDLSNIILSNTFTSFNLRPKRTLDRTTEVRHNILEYIGETMLYPGFKECIENFYNIKSQIFTSRQLEYPKVVFFGTGSCIPNKTRNTSCILARLNENSNIILDCGEGSFGQIVRYYGEKDTVEIMKNLKAIYLSHLHADHHLGLIGILQNRREILNSHNVQVDNPLYLLAPKQIMTWLTVYHKRFENILQEFELIPNSSLCVKHNEFANITDEVLGYIGAQKIETCLVNHCPNSFGISIVTNNAKKITYSGDTLPCKELVDIGMNSDLLIHEATMEDALIAEAKYKMHSTVSQAVNIGRKMNAKFTLLTHFSQRYARVPILPLDIENAEKKDVGIAFDNMEVTLDDLKILPYLYPVLKIMFADHFDDLEDKATKRAMKRERNKSPINLNNHQSRSQTSPFAKKSTPDLGNNINTHII